MIAPGPSPTRRAQRVPPTEGAARTPMIRVCMRCSLLCRGSRSTGERGWVERHTDHSEGQLFELEPGAMSFGSPGPLPPKPPYAEALSTFYARGQTDRRHACGPALEILWPTVKDRLHPHLPRPGLPVARFGSPPRQAAIRSPHNAASVQ